MLQAHSLLWHYLWVGPNVFLVALAVLLWRRSLSHKVPAFVAFAVFASMGQLAVYLADISPTVSGETFWRVDWASLIVESLLKFLVIGEAFSRLFNPYPAISKLGRTLVSGIGGGLVLLAVLVSAYSRGDNTNRLVAGAHLLELSAFIITLGLILFLFGFASYFRLTWDRLSFGVLLGFGFSACVHLSTWAIMTNANPSPHQRVLLDFFNMGAYHICVLLWSYYLLVPSTVAARPPQAKPPQSKPPESALPDTNLDLWNRELERLLQQ